MQELISKQEIDQKVKILAKQIGEHYSQYNISKKNPLQLVALLKGSVIFLSDLIRNIDLPLHINFMEVSSYGDEKVSSGKLVIHCDLRQSMKDKHVLLVEDIIDTGLTLNHIYEKLQDQSPASLQIAALLHKKEKSRFRYQANFVGFPISDEFVVGYGLDYQNLYRNLPFIAILD